MIELTWDFVNQVKLSEHFVKQTYQTCELPEAFGLPQIVVPQMIEIPDNIEADSGDYYSDELNNVQQEYEIAEVKDEDNEQQQPIYEMPEINNQPTVSGFIQILDFSYNFCYFEQTSNDSSSVQADIKPFLETCPVCAKTFKTPGYLEKHLSTHATQSKGQGNFKCSHCPKYFTQRSFLEVHQRKHTGVKPYICLYCPKRLDFHFIHSVLVIYCVPFVGLPNLVTWQLTCENTPARNHILVIIVESSLLSMET